jgi:hypothetical protein
MLRKEFIEGIGNVVQSIAEAGIPQALEVALRPVSDRTKFNVILDANRKFASRYDTFGPSERAIDLLPVDAPVFG